MTVARNTLANSAPEGSWTSRLIKDLKKHSNELAEDKKRKRRLRREEGPKHGNGNRC